MKPLKIVGVPEHFNFPWQLCFDSEEFEKEGIKLVWTDIPEGTGKMCQMLRSGDADIAVILTEGIVKDIIEGNPSKIVQIYVETPLIWGVHVAKKSNYTSITDLENTKAAISRIGSGSQLMAFIHAENNGWRTDNLQFEIVNTIDGAITALTNETADYFMWEHFMTKPLVDSGVFRRLDDCPTPWPCFVIAVRTEILENQSETIRKILKIINEKTAVFKAIPDIDKSLAKKYNQKIEDIQEWLSKTEWSQKDIEITVIDNVQKKLFQLEIIDKPSESSFFKYKNSL